MLNSFQLEILFLLSSNIKVFDACCRAAIGEANKQFKGFHPYASDLSNTNRVTNIFEIQNGYHRISKLGTNFC